MAMTNLAPRRFASQRREHRGADQGEASEHDRLDPAKPVRDAAGKRIERNHACCMSGDYGADPAFAVAVVFHV